MGRGGGGGGGGHSSGGSSRSSGGRSFSSHRGGSSSHSRGGSSSYSSYHSHSSYIPRVRVSNYNYGRPYGGYTSTSVHLSGWSAVMIGFCVIVAILFMIGLSVGPMDVSRSTIEREALKPNAPFDKQCIMDEVSWIYDRNTVTKGMETFYKQTGVQPYLIITDNINGEKNCSTNTIDSYANERYDNMAQGNEKAILFVFFEWRDSDVDVWYVCGNEAQAIMDTEATDILCDYAESLYTSDLSDEEYFAQIWIKTAKRIMSVTPTMANQLKWVCIPIAILLVVVGAFILMRTKRKHERERAAETERILSHDIEEL